MSAPCILFAADKFILQAIKPALTTWKVEVASHISQVLQIIKNQHVDLFLIDIHFDDSMAMELTEAIRADSAYTNTPVLLFRLLPSAHADLLRYTVLQMIAAYKVALYLELEDSDDAASELRVAVQNYLPTKETQNG